MMGLPPALLCYKKGKVSLRGWESPGPTMRRLALPLSQRRGRDFKVPPDFGPATQVELWHALDGCRFPRSFPTSAVLLPTCASVSRRRYKQLSGYAQDV